MKSPKRRYFTEKQKAEMWDRWQKRPFKRIEKRRSYRQKMANSDHSSRNS